TSRPRPMRRGSDISMVSGWRSRRRSAMPSGRRSRRRGTCWSTRSGSRSAARRRSSSWHGATPPAATRARTGWQSVTEIRSKQGPQFSASREEGVEMNELALFIGFWADEAPSTHKVISRIPEGSDYRPDPKSRTAQEIAWQIVWEERMIIEALETGKAEWNPAPMPSSMREIADAYAKQSEDIVER